MSDRLPSITTIATAILLWAGNGSADQPPVAAGVKDQPATVANHDDFVEPGRFGLLGAVTDDAFQFGGLRVDEHYEIAFTADASFASRGGSSAIHGGLGDVGLTLRGGPRFSLGHLNYLSFGAQGHMPLLGKDDGLSTAGSYAVGPYVGVSRNFAGTPLMITLWVLPYEFSRDLFNDGAGNQVSLEQHKFFQAGGFGLAYLL